MDSIILIFDFFQLRFYNLTPSIVDFLNLNPEFTTWLPRVAKVLHAVKYLLLQNIMQAVLKNIQIITTIICRNICLEEENFH